MFSEIETKASDQTESRLFRWFLLTIFIYYLIPDLAGYRVHEELLINLRKILIVVLLVGFVICRKQLYSNRYDRLLLALILIHASSRFISIFNASSHVSSFLFWLSSCFYWYFFYYAAMKLIQSETKVDKALKVYVFSAAVVALFNLIEYFTGFYLPYLLPGVKEVNVYWTYDRLGITRVFGLLTDPVATSYYLIPAIPFGMYFYHKMNSKLWLYLSIFLCVGSFLNISRIAIIALFLMLLLYQLLIRRTVFAVITIMILGLIIIDNPVKSLIMESINPTTWSGKDLNKIYVDRMSGIFDIGPYIIQNAPYFGYGTGSMARETLMDMYRWHAGFLYNYGTEFPAFYRDSMESGIIAGISFFALFLIAMIKSFSIAKSCGFHRNDPSNYLFLAFVGYLVCLSSNGVYSSLGVFFFLLGILNVKINNGVDL